jgi:hypothetical protein
VALPRRGSGGMGTVSCAIDAVSSPGRTVCSIHSHDSDPLLNTTSPSRYLAGDFASGCE